MGDRTHATAGGSLAPVDRGVDPGRLAAGVELIQRLLSQGYRSRSRALPEINRRLLPKGPPLEEIVKAFVSAGREPRVLEIGFGWGRVLAELAWRFRSAPVSLEGINRERQQPVGEPEDLAAVAVAFGIAAPGEVRGLPLPELHFYDATNLQFPDESFDLVYSAVCIRFIADKARLIEEVGRVLRPGGRALLEIDEKHWEYPAGPSAEPDLLSDAACRMVLRHGTEMVPLDDYLDWAGGTRYTLLVARRRHCVIDLTKHGSGPLSLGLELDQLRTLPSARFVRSEGPRKGKPCKKGIRSVYCISNKAMETFLASR